MSTRLLICDDSNMARKQVARSLPDGWDVDISFAANGAEGIEAIKAGKGDVLLLDLNMPVMDGYEVLQTIVKEDLPTLTIVISGDIQPEAHQRVTSLGALDFIQKPVNKEKLTEILLSYGVFTKEETLASEQKPEQKRVEDVKENHIEVVHEAVEFEQLDNNLRDCYQEIANVAMGRAGDLLARLLNVFVMLPIPNVNLIEVSEINMALSAVNKETTSGVCQGFISSGISGEALLIINDSGFKDIATLMNIEPPQNENAELELLMDMGNVLIGACLKGVSEQLDVSFSQGHPVVLGQHINVNELISSSSKRWQRTLAIEISYGIENHPIKCDLLLLFTEQSMKTLNNKLAYLMDE
ncbi:response regulator [Thalassotalea agariperforans]